MPVARAFMVTPGQKIGHDHLECFVSFLFCGKMLTPRNYGAAPESTHSTVCTRWDRRGALATQGSIWHYDALIEISHVVTRLAVESPLL